MTFAANGFGNSRNLAYKAKPAGIEFLSNWKKDLFPDGIVSGSVLVTNISFGAAALGSGHVEIKDADNWWFVASETNWLAEGLEDTQTELTLFKEVVQFPQLSSESFRPEIFVSVFSDHAYLDLNGQYHHLHGAEPQQPLPHKGVVPPWCVYVLGFSIL